MDCATLTQTVIRNSLNKYDLYRKCGKNGATAKWHQTEKKLMRPPTQVTRMRIRSSKPFIIASNQLKARGYGERTNQGYPLGNINCKLPGNIYTESAGAK